MEISSAGSIKPRLKTALNLANKISGAAAAKTEKTGGGIQRVQNKTAFLKRLLLSFQAHRVRVWVN